MAVKVKLQPYGDRVVVTAVKDEEVLSSGIVIPDTAKEKPLQGEVVAVGPGKWEDGKQRPLDVKNGDRILYRKYAGQEFKLGTDEYLVIEEKDILGKVLK
jgi:chaperonin GroES